MLPQKHFFTNRSNLVHLSVGIPGISDHDTIAYVESLSRAKYQKPIKSTVLIWKRANMEAMRLDMTKFAQEFNSKYTESTYVNSLWLAFTDKCSKLMDEHIPSKMTEA